MRSTVAVVRCEDYDRAAASAAVARGFELLGGAERFVTIAGEHLLLKPNLLVSSAPESCVTTHPAVFRAVAEQLAAAGARLSYGDSPGFGNPRSVARKAGLESVAEELGIPFADFSDGRQVPFPDGELIKTWFIANGALDADGIVSLPKMKTHGLSRMTGAVKNQFGCVPGMRKGEFHARMSDVRRFSTMLVDLNRLLQTRLFVMDGIVAMEGNGPRNGDPRPARVLLFSEDPVALDATACRIMNLDPSLVETVVMGEQFGLGTATDIEYLGDDVDEFVLEDFVVNRSPRLTTENAEGRLSGLMRRFVVPKPYIVPERCTSCGTCVRVCPVEPKAVDFPARDADAGEHPRHDYSLCIRCYCCQEMCPERAIEIKTPLLGRVIHG